LYGFVSELNDVKGKTIVWQDRDITCMGYNIATQWADNKSVSVDILNPSRENIRALLKYFFASKTQSVGTW
jgi:hypothetical protein